MALALLRDLCPEVNAAAFFAAWGLPLRDVQRTRGEALFACCFSTIAKMRFCRALDTPKCEASSEAVFAVKGSVICLAMNTANFSNNVKCLLPDLNTATHYFRWLTARLRFGDPLHKIKAGSQSAWCPRHPSGGFPVLRVFLSFRITVGAPSFGTESRAAVARDSFSPKRVGRSISLRLKDSSPSASHYLPPFAPDHKLTHDALA